MENKFGDFQWGNEEELKPWHIMNMVPLILQGSGFSDTFFLRFLSKINKIIKFSMKYELFTAIKRQSEMNVPPKIRWFILTTIKKLPSGE